MQLSLAEDETEDIANKIFLEKLEAHDISYRLYLQLQLGLW